MSMVDMLPTIMPKSNQLNADHLLARPLTIKIIAVSARKGEQPIAIDYEGGDGLPYLPCKSMRRVLVHVWGKDGNDYVGRQMTLYRDPDVLWAGQKAGGIRISHMSHMERPVTLSLTESQKSRKPYTVRPLVLEAPSDDQVISRIRAALGKAGTQEKIDSIRNHADAQRLMEHIQIDVDAAIKRITPEVTSGEEAA